MSCTANPLYIVVDNKYFGPRAAARSERTSAEGSESIEGGRVLGGWLLGRVEAGGAELGCDRGLRGGEGDSLLDNCALAEVCHLSLEVVAAVASTLVRYAP